MTQEKKQQDEALARAYREGAQGDAHHALSGQGGYDPTLVTTPELPHEPMRDGTKYDAVDSENRNVPPHPKGPDYDKILRGLEPGETSVE